MFPAGGSYTAELNQLSAVGYQPAYLFIQYQLWKLHSNECSWHVEILRRCIGASQITRPFSLRKQADFSDPGCIIEANERKKSN